MSRGDFDIKIDFLYRKKPETPQGLLRKTLLGHRVFCERPRLNMIKS
jgi:hypothetical protein